MILFSSRSVKTLTLDTDLGPVTAEIVALPRRHFEKAAQDSQVDGFAFMGRLRNAGDSELFTQIQSLSKDAKEMSKARRADPLIGFSVDVILAVGLRSLDGVKPSSEVLADIPPEMSEHIAREILRITKPSLFAAVPADTTEPQAVADAQHEADRKNDSAPITSI